VREMLRALSGDLNAADRILAIPPIELGNAQSERGVPLVLKRSAVISVLHDLLEGRFPRPRIQEWVSFVRWGYIVPQKLTAL
jgi:hypothetical protein